jgi:16S rRNA (uracil1498-N3)-methyltransferase
MSERYFVDAPITSGRAVLTGTEAHHLLHVMRAAGGTAVTLFDGTGWEFDAVVESTKRSEVELSIIGRQQVDREAATTLTLGVALPKGDRQKWLVEKATELGVARLVPLATQRGVAQPGENAIERLRRTVIEASKQCGRNHLMEIAAPQTWDHFLTANGHVNCRLIAHPTSQSHSGLISSQIIVAAIGPEGGLTDEEVSTAVAQGWQVVFLGRRILRVETAAVALAAKLIGD